MEKYWPMSPQVKSRTSPEPLSSNPRIYPNLSAPRPLSPHSEYQDYQHQKGFPSIRHPDFDSSSRLCWPQNGDDNQKFSFFCKLIFCLDHPDSFRIKKERSVSVEETEYIDKKIRMAERFFVNVDNPLLSRWILKIPIYQKFKEKFAAMKRSDQPAALLNIMILIPEFLQPVVTTYRWEENTFIYHS